MFKLKYSKEHRKPYTWSLSWHATCNYGGTHAGDGNTSSNPPVALKMRRKGQRITFEVTNTRRDRQTPSHSLWKRSRGKYRPLNYKKKKKNVAGSDWAG